MRLTVARLLTPLAGAALMLAANIGYAQHFTESVCPDDAHAEFHACATAVTPEPPRRADGRPDFSGHWRRRGWAFENYEAHPANADDFGGPSVVIDPPDGKVPYQPWAEAQRLKEIDCPVQFIWGDHDAVCHPSVQARVDEVRAAKPGVRVDLVVDAGHWVQYDAPHEVNRLLLDFMK